MTTKPKTMLITGASRGIGKTAALHFAASGYNLVLLARNPDQLAGVQAEITAAGGQAEAIVGDVSHYPDVQKAVDMAQERFGRLDCLINNAGVIDPISHIAESDPEAWSHVVDVNLKGVYYGLRAAIPVMLSQGGGTIINISSGAATSALEGWSHYCATKAGVLSLTKCAAKEYGDQGLRVVGLSPGTVATDMQVVIKRSGINPVSKLDPSVHIPAQWVAEAIAFLMSDAGAHYQGEDFSLKHNEGRALVGLPPLT